MRLDALNLKQARLTVKRSKNSLSTEQPIEGDELRAVKRYLASREDKLHWLFVVSAYLPFNPDPGLPRPRWNGRSHSPLLLRTGGLEMKVAAFSICPDAVAESGENALQGVGRRQHRYHDDEHDQQDGHRPHKDQQVSHHAFYCVPRSVFMAGLPVECCDQTRRLSSFIGRRRRPVRPFSSGRSSSESPPASAFGLVVVVGV